MITVKLVEGKILEPFQQRIVDEYNEVESALLNLNGRLKKLNNFIEHGDFENLDGGEKQLLRFQRVTMDNTRRYLEVYLSALAVRMEHQGFAICERKGV